MKGCLLMVLLIMRIKNSSMKQKWPKQSWEEGEIGGKSREEGEKEKLTFREEGEIGSKSKEKGDLTPCSTPLPNGGEKRIELAQFLTFVCTNLYIHFQK